jgi:hypothetical protein
VRSHKFGSNIKPCSAFIFTIHIPKISLFGDAEQILACSFVTNKISVQCGGADYNGRQKRSVNIIEDGKEAFGCREEIYQIWKSWNY